MSRSLNKVLLIGNTGQEPEVRTAASGTKVAKFSLATSQGKKGEEKTQWHRVTCFAKLADVVEQYVGKGHRLYVEGRIEYSQTEDEAGRPKYWTDIIAEELIMLDSKER